MGIYSIECFKKKEDALEYYAKWSKDRMDKIIDLYKIQLQTNCDCSEIIDKLTREWCMYNEYFHEVVKLIIAEAEEES